MRTYLAAALAAVLLFSGSAVTFAAQGSKAASHATATHATADRIASGTVKSIDATKLVLKTPRGEMTFSLGSTTPENIATGSMVQVHYRAEGKGRLATSVMLDTAAAAKK
ncbi:MAG: hypothetical protein K2Y23_16470 [Cyanobacteria bacterium]|nr:hypothetical protein [Cyanobacteriota bacterium]